MKTRIEISSLATNRLSGVAGYTRLLSEALSDDAHNRTYGHFFNFLNRQPQPDVNLKNGSLEKNGLVPLRVYAKLQSYNIAPPFDIFRPKVDLTIFPNFATWPTMHSKLRATVIHDLTYLYYPELVEEKNLAHLQRVVPRSIKSADFIITVSESVKAELVKEFGLKSANCIVTTIPPSKTFREKKSSDTIMSVRKKYNIHTEKYIYFIGNLEPRKNLATLIEAYKLLPDSIREEYSLVLAGAKGWKTNATQTAIDEAIRSGENVQHIGFIDQKDSPALYQGASVFVMPSLYEGFGMPVLEAITSRTPVIASDIPVLHEAGGLIAHYANPHSAASFARAIESILSSTIPKDYEVMRRKHLDSFSWEKNVDTIQKKAQQLLRT